jgi:hypothetical protein
MLISSRLLEYEVWCRMHAHGLAASHIGWRALAHRGWLGQSQQDRSASVSDA